MSRLRPARARPRPGAGSLAGLLAVAGATHLVRPRVYEPMVPRRLGPPRAWVLWSGVAELGCALGLLAPRTRRPAAVAAAGLFVAVFPANVTMALRSGRRGSAAYRAATWARLPLQAPLVRWALRVARDAA